MRQDKMKKNKFSIVLGMILFGLFCIFTGMLISNILWESNIFSNQDKEVGMVHSSITESCEGLDLFETSECLNSNVRGLFKFNISNIGKELTFEELKEQGGVCSHYADLYYEAGEELGFNMKRVNVYTDKTQPINIRHAFTVISGKEGYCVLDGRNMNCIRLVPIEVNKNGIIENGSDIR